MDTEANAHEGAESVSYSDPRHPKVAAAATKMFRAALALAEEDAVSISDFWDVFNAFTQKYQYGQFMDSLTHDMKSELRAAIQLEYYTELRLEARTELKKDIRKEQEDAIYSEVYDELRAEIEAEATEKLTFEVEESVRSALTDRLTAEIKPQVEAALKVELMGNSIFVDEARKEIQRKMLGLE